MLSVVLPLIGVCLLPDYPKPVPYSSSIATAQGLQVNVFEQWSAAVLVLEQDDIGTTAFLVTKSGLVATAASKVLGKSVQPAIRMPDNKRYVAKILQNDLTSGVALLQVNPDVISHLKPIPIQADTVRQPSVGDTIKAIENRPTTGILPLAGMVSSTTDGILALDIKRDGYIAGSPLFAEDGRLIGMASDIANLKNRTASPLPIIPIAAVSAAIAANQDKLGAPPSRDALPSISPTMIPTESLKAAYASGAEAIKTLSTIPGMKLAIYTPFTIQRADHKINDDLVKQYKGMPIDEIKSKHPEYITTSDAVRNFIGRDDLPIVIFEYALTLFDRPVRLDRLSKTRTLQDAYEYHNGFLEMKLYRGDTEIPSVRQFRFEHPNYSRKGAEKGDEFNTMSAFVMFDPRAFEPSVRLTVKVLTASKADEWITFQLDEKFQRQLWDDFADWRALNPK